MFVCLSRINTQYNNTSLLSLITRGTYTENEFTSFLNQTLYSPSYDEHDASIFHHKTTQLVFLNDLGRKIISQKKRNDYWKVDGI